MTPPARTRHSSPARPVAVVSRVRGVRARPAAMRRLVAALEQRGLAHGWSVPPGTLSVVLLDEPEHSQLHADYCGDPSPTDVITFPGDGDGETAGEICLSVPCARLEAGRRGHSPADELALYLAHGWLHLAGLDDLTPADRRAMRRAERLLLDGLPVHLASQAFPVSQAPSR